jgi:hypothetical protein
MELRFMATAHSLGHITKIKVLCVLCVLCVVTGWIYFPQSSIYVMIIQRSVSTSMMQVVHW